MTPLPDSGGGSRADERKLAVALLSAMIRKDRQGARYLESQSSVATLRSLAGLTLVLLINKEGGTREVEEWLQVLAMELARSE